MPIKYDSTHGVTICGRATCCQVSRYGAMGRWSHEYIYWHYVVCELISRKSMQRDTHGGEFTKERGVTDRINKRDCAGYSRPASCLASCLRCVSFDENDYLTHSRREKERKKRIGLFDISWQIALAREELDSTMHPCSPCSPCIALSLHYAYSLT